jgi:hypothetical protein
VAWIFDKRMNPLYDSVLEMIPSTDKKILQNTTSQIEKPTTKRSRRIWGILICDQNCVSIYSSVIFPHFASCRAASKKYAAKISKIIFYCFTAIVRRIESENDEFSQCPVYREKDLLILVIKYENKCLDYKLYFKFDVDRNMIELKIIVIHKSLRNDSKCQQTHSFQRSESNDSKCQETHSLQRSLSSDSKCLETHSLQKIEKRNIYFQQILLLKYMNLKLYMMYDALLHSFRLIGRPGLPDLSIEVLLTLNPDPGKQ